LTEQRKERGRSPIDVRRLAPEDAPAVAELIERTRHTRILPVHYIGQLAATPPEKLVAFSGRFLAGFLFCAWTPERLTAIWDLCVAPELPWRRVAGALLDALVVSGGKYEVILPESDSEGMRVFRAHGFGPKGSDRVWLAAFGDEAGIVLRRLPEE
jgi:ribosomal protein S18 acetylase RimI-like enzyme